MNLFLFYALKCHLLIISAANQFFISFTKIFIVSLEGFFPILSQNSFFRNFSYFRAHLGVHVNALKFGSLPKKIGRFGTHAILFNFYTKYLKFSQQIVLRFLSEFFPTYFISLSILEKCFGSFKHKLNIKIINYKC